MALGLVFRFSYKFEWGADPKGEEETIMPIICAELWLLW